MGRLFTLPLWGSFYWPVSSGRCEIFQRQHSSINSFQENAVMRAVIIWPLKLGNTFLELMALLGGLRYRSSADKSALYHSGSHFWVLAIWSFGTSNDFISTQLPVLNSFLPKIPALNSDWYDQSLTKFRERRCKRGDSRLSCPLPVQENSVPALVSCAGVGLEQAQWGVRQDPLSGESSQGDTGWPTEMGGDCEVQVQQDQEMSLEMSAGARLCRAS